MANASLAVKYRPKSFEHLTEQASIKDILLNQIETETFQHAYLFTGPAGTGKTTSARIFGNLMNGDEGNLIEVDAASNSGVDNIRGIIEDAKKKPISSKYKIYIIDECHSLSNGAWQAMLKLLEEPPLFSIFILCTTDPQKIPDTILSRVQRFQFNKISDRGIAERLYQILAEEQSPDIAEQCEDELFYIAKLADGGMRDAISMLDKCLSYNTDLSMKSILMALGSEDYNTFFQLLNALQTGDEIESVGIIDKIYAEGKDLKQLIKEFSKFILEVMKYQFNNSFEYITIPETYKNDLEVDWDLVDIAKMIVSLLEKIKWENDPRSIVGLQFILFCKDRDEE